MFNVWLPAVLESRAKGEGDEAIRSALKEFVLYSSKSPWSRVMMQNANTQWPDVPARLLERG